MKTGIFLSYKGLGANLLHLSYCHEIAKKFGPVTLITLNPKLKEVLTDEEYYKLDKEAKWPTVNRSNVCIVNEGEDNFSLDIKEALSKK